MIASYYEAVMTEAGIKAVNRQVMEGALIEFTRFGIGDGIYTDAEKSVYELEKAEGLKSEKNTYGISSKDMSADGRSIKLKFVITNCDGQGGSLVDESYYANEIGLFAKAAGGAEFLFSIAVCSGEEGDAIIAYDGSNPIQIIQTYEAVVANSDQVVINLTGAFALAEEVEKKADGIRYDRETGKLCLLSGKTEISETELENSAVIAKIEELEARVTLLERAIEKMSAFSYSIMSEQILASDGSAEYSDGDETIILADDLAEYTADDETIILAGGSGGGAYILPAATESRLGGVKKGNGVNIAADGTISVDAEAILTDYDVMATDEEVDEAIGR